VDAERGVSFRRLPRVLAIQLKRFRYDFRLGQRLKVNSLFTFPTTIDMAEYVRPTPGDSPPGKATSADVTPRGNLEATAEETAGGVSAGEAMADSPAGDPMAVDSTPPTAPLAEGMSVAHPETETACSGPLPYELYAVLVHSGSASFGHYYALIKDLGQGDAAGSAGGGDGRGEWHEFNDAYVRPIKESELRTKAFGGEGGGYSGSSSAYMLLYRAVGACDASSGEAAVDASDSIAQAVSQHALPLAAPVAATPAAAAPAAASSCGDGSCSSRLDSSPTKRLRLTPDSEAPAMALGAAGSSVADDSDDNPYTRMGF